MYEYKTSGTCSQRILFDVVDGKVQNVQFIGGCNGNLKGIGSLVEGMDIDDIIAKLLHVDGRVAGGQYTFGQNWYI